MNRKRSILTQFVAQREVGRSKHVSCLFDSRMCEKLLEDRASTVRKRQPCELSGQCRSTFLMVFSPDKTKIASTHGDHTVRVTNIQTGKCSHVLTGHPRTPWCIAFHPTFEDLLATGCLAGEVRIWDLRGGCSEVWRSSDCLPISSLTFHPLDHLLVVAVGHRLYFWDWTESEPFTERETCQRDQRVRWVKFDALGQHLYTAIAHSVLEGSRQYSTVSEPTVQHAPWPRPYRDVVSDISAGLNLPRQNAVDIEDTQLSDYLSGSQRSNEFDSDGVRRWSVRMRPYNSLDDDSSVAAGRERSDYLSRAGRGVNSSRPGLVVEDDDTDAGSSFYRGSAVRRMINLSAARTSADALSDPDSDTEPEDSSRPEFWENMRAHALRYRRYHHLPPIGRSLLNRVSAPLGQARLSSGELQSRLPIPSLDSPMERRSRMRSMLLRNASDARRFADESNRDCPYADAMHPIRRLSVAELLRERVLNGTLISRNLSEELDRPAASTLHDSNVYSTTASRSSNDAGVAEQFTELRSSPALSSASASRAPLTIGDYGRQSLASLVTSRRRDTDSSLSSLRSSLRLDAASIAPLQPTVPCTQSNITRNSQAGVTCVGNGPRCVICQNYCNPPASSTSSLGISSPRPLLPFHRRPFTGVDQPPDASAGGSDLFSSSTSAADSGTSTTGTQRNNSAFRDFTSSVLAAVTAPTSESSTVGASEAALDQLQQQQQRNVASAVMSTESGRDVMWSSQDSVPSSSENSELFVPPPVLDSFELNLADMGLVDGSQDEPTASEPTADMASVLRGDSQDADDQNEITLPRLWRSSEYNEQLANNLRSSTVNYYAESASLWQSLNEAESSVSREIPYRWGTGNRPSESGSPPRRLASEDEGEYRRRVEMLESIERRIEMLQAMRMRMQGLRTLQTRIQSVSAQEGRLRTLRSIQDRLQAMRTLRERTQTLTALQGRIERLRDNLNNSRRQMMREGHRLLPADPDFHDAASLDDATGYVRVAVNRAFEGAFTSSAEVVNSGNANQIFRIQRWDFGRGDIPDISNSTANVVVDRCKVHNDATCDLSQDGRLMAVLQPRDIASFHAEMLLSIYSLMPDTLGERLATKSFGANTVSVSFSPLGRYVVVGMASRRRSWMVMTKQIIGQVYRLDRQTGNPAKMELQHICDLSHPVDLDPRSHVSVNSIRWLPASGAGLVYGTSRGDMVICTPSFDETKSTQVSGGDMDTHRVRRNLVQLLTRGTVESASTQTTVNGRRLSTAGTQTDSADAFA